MRTLLCLLLIATTFNARAATYLLLSQTNALAQGITNQAKVYTDSVTNSTIAAATNSAKSYTDSHSGGGSAPVGTVVASGTNAAGMVLTAADDKLTNGVWSDPIWTTNVDATIMPFAILRPVVLGNTNAYTEWSNEEGGPGAMLIGRYDVSRSDPDTLWVDFGVSADGNVYRGGSDIFFFLHTNAWEVGFNFDSELGKGAFLHTKGNDNGMTFRLGAENNNDFFRASASAGTLDFKIQMPDNDLTPPIMSINESRIATFSDAIAAGTTNQWKTGDYFTNYVELTVNSNTTRLVAEDNSGNVTIPGTLSVNTATFTNFTATHLTVNDITASNKLVSTSPTTTALTNGYAAAITNTWGIFDGNTSKFVNGAGVLSTPAGGSGSTNISDSGYTAVILNATVRTNFSVSGKAGFGIAADTATPVTIEYDAIGDETTVLKGLYLTNGTAAANNAQQASPPIVMQGNGWRTSGSPNNAPVAMRILVLPVQGGTANTAALHFQSSINNGSWTDDGSIDSNGALNIAGSSATVSSSGFFVFNGRSKISSGGADGTILLQNNGATAVAALQTGVPVLAKTTNYTILFTDSNTIFSNVGASTNIDLTLPTWARGLTFTFVTDATQTIKVIAPASNTIRLGSDVTSSGGSITNNATAGDVLTISAYTTNKWIGTTHEGTWTTH